MKFFILPFWTVRKSDKKKVREDLDRNVVKNFKEVPNIWRDILAYWLLGLCTEFGYVNDGKPTLETPSSSPEYDLTTEHNICETQSTGVLLVADIVPSVLMSIVCPFLPLAKNFRMCLVIALNITSFLLIANTETEYLAIIGVVFTSLGLGIGEVTLLSYSAQFNKNEITAWSSGTGSSAVIGSISWAGLIALGIDPRDTMRLMLIVPVIQGVAFWCLLRSPEKSLLKNHTDRVDISTIESNGCPTDCVLPKLEEKLSGLKAKLKCLPSLSTFICPLVFVFIFEYICVSGLFEMIYVRDTWMDRQSQYRWFLVAYQIGVFTSRSMGSLLTARRTWWAPIVQCANACYFLYEASTSNSSMVVIFLLVFWVGVVGGLCYVHSFQRLIKELPKNQHKFSLGMITIAESFGIAIGGFAAIPIHNVLCEKYLS